MKIHPLLKRASLSMAAFSMSLLASHVLASTFTLPSPNESILGNLEYITASPTETTPTLAQHYNLGQNALIAANKGIRENARLPDGSRLTIPTEFLLPPLPRQGIIVNLAEMRMYYFPKGSNVVMTFPIGIGKIGKTIPIENTSITRKVVNPTWTPPEDIRQFNREQGIELPRTMGPGPDNPLGPYAIYLRIPTYLIHSTIFPESIGRRASFGCIRMNEDDIKEFFPSVQPGTPVAIVDMPIKVAWQDSYLVLEAHPPLEERSHLVSLDTVVNSVEQSMPLSQLTFVNWQLVAYLANHPDGIPHPIGVRVS